MLLNDNNLKLIQLGHCPVHPKDKKDKALQFVRKRNILFFIETYLTFPYFSLTVKFKATPSFWRFLQAVTKVVQNTVKEIIKQLPYNLNRYTVEYIPLFIKVSTLGFKLTVEIIEISNKFKSLGAKQI